MYRQLCCREIMEDKIKELPSNVLSHIARYLTFGELAKVKNIDTKDDTLWYHKFIHDFPEMPTYKPANITWKDYYIENACIIGITRLDIRELEVSLKSHIVDTFMSAPYIIISITGHIWYAIIMDRDPPKLIKLPLDGLICTTMILKVIGNTTYVISDVDIKKFMLHTIVNDKVIATGTYNANINGGIVITKIFNGNLLIATSRVFIYIKDGHVDIIQHAPFNASYFACMIYPDKYVLIGTDNFIKIYDAQFAVVHIIDMWDIPIYPNVECLRYACYFVEPFYICINVGDIVYFRLESNFKLTLVGSRLLTKGHMHVVQTWHNCLTVLDTDSGHITRHILNANSIDTAITSDIPLTTHTHVNSNNNIILFLNANSRISTGYVFDSRCLGLAEVNLL